VNNLMSAHRQWATRPSDERFQTLAEMHKSISKRRQESQESTLNMRDIVLHTNGEMVVQTHTHGLTLSNWSAGQLLSKLGIPRDLLAKLTSTTADAVLADRLHAVLNVEKTQETKQRILLQWRSEGTPLIRAFHGSRYARLWDAAITGMLMEYLPPGWRNPVAFKDGKWGGPLVPSGLYAGDRNMFAFFIDGGDASDTQRPSFDVDGDAFNRGFIISNSEVGSDTFTATRFRMRYVCGNNIIWGAEDVHTIRARHTRKVSTSFHEFRRYLETLNTSADETLFVKAVRAAKSRVVVPITRKKDEVLDGAFDKFKGKFTQATIIDSLDAILREEKGAKGTAWDWLQGFTAAARSIPNADDRLKVETTASNLLLVAR